MSTIHQFSPIIAQGDGVSGSVFYIRSLLRSLGHSSDIYASNSVQWVNGEVAPLTHFDSGSCDVLLVHHSMGHEHESWLRTTDCPRILIYHNITPAYFFHPDSSEHFYSIRGREQLREWKTLFCGAISVSPYNSIDLEEAGYKDVAVMPLLIDQSKFDDTTEPPDPAWRLHQDDRLIVSVGRIAQNKRQHLLLEALWHLLRMAPESQTRLVLVGGTTSADYHHQLLARISELGLQHNVTFTGKCSDGQLRWLYRNAGLMWCASAHEGFCIPLVEANYFSLPVLSFATSNIPDTMGQSGLLIEESDPLAMAAVTASLNEDSVLAENLLKAGTENLQRYAADTLLPSLRNYLEKHGISPEVR